MGSGYSIARAVEQLVASGHSVEQVWEYTPRQLSGYVALAYRRRMGLLAEQFVAGQIAAQGGAKGSKSFLRKLLEESL
jgi:hypothetical protein